MKGLSRAPVDIIDAGDYQAAERKFGLSRQMLEVCPELLQAIGDRAVVVVAFSIINSPGSAQSGALREMERLAPPRPDPRKIQPQIQLR